MDLSGIINASQSHIPGSEFPVGSTDVSYTYYDTSGNHATCSFAVIVQEGRNQNTTVRPILVSMSSFLINFYDKYVFLLPSLKISDCIQQKTMVVVNEMSFLL